jgi:hypothetical protein
MRLWFRSGTERAAFDEATAILRSARRADLETMEQVVVGLRAQIQGSSSEAQRMVDREIAKYLAEHPERRGGVRRMRGPVGPGPVGPGPEDDETTE